MSGYQKLMEKTQKLFRERFSYDPERVVSAPGRSNLIGEHTDYNEGHVLPIAIDRFTVAAASNRTDRACRLYTANIDEGFEFDLDRLPEERPDWVSYLMGVMVGMEQEGFPITGKDILVHGNIPIGSGISSSAALEISAATVIERLEGLNIEDARIVNICRRAEHHFVGIQSGPMDQFASRACRAGHAGLLDCRSLEMTHHPLPEGLLYLSIYSGIPRTLAASAYNERQRSCQKAVSVLSNENPGINALRDATPEMVESAKDLLEEKVYRRARHVVTEESRVFRLVDAFEKRDFTQTGTILMEGHFSLSRDYEVSLPILDDMVHWLYDQGVVGARLTGAGFGGSLICLIQGEKTNPEKFSRSFVETFASKTPEPPAMWVLTTVDGAKYRP